MTDLGHKQGLCDIWRLNNLKQYLKNLKYYNYTNLVNVLILSGPLLLHGMYEFFLYISYKLQAYNANTKSLPSHFLRFLAISQSSREFHDDQEAPAESR